MRSAKSILSLYFAKYIVRKNDKWKKNAVNHQDKLMHNLVSKAKDTVFGKDHKFKNIKNYSDFKSSIAVSDYEGLKKYIDKLKLGEENILWPGRPIYFC